MKIRSNNQCLSFCNSSSLYLLLVLTLITSTHCDATRSMSRRLLHKAPSTHQSSLFLITAAKLNLVKYLNYDSTSASSNSGSYGVSSPLTLPPYDSLAPISLPEDSPPYCADPPPNTPQSPPAIIPSPIGYTPLPPPYYNVPPILPIQTPPPTPSGEIPSPAGGFPSPSAEIPSPTAGFLTPPTSGGFPSPFGDVPSPTGGFLSPPDTGGFPSPSGQIPSPSGGFPSPSGQIPSPSGGFLSPPDFSPNPNPPSTFVPSPPSLTPSPTIPTPYYEPSPPDSVPNPPFTFPSPIGFTPSPSVFLPPTVYPAPHGPPPRNSAPTTALWCVAKPTVPDPIIQEAMNYACGSGADCDSIQPDRNCFKPNTLFAHASYAFNSYWQRTKVAGGSCEFGGTAILVTVDPSYDGCHFVYY